MEFDGQQKSEEIVYRAGTIYGPSFDVRDRSIDKVWLVKDPKLYFPLNQDIPQSTRGQERKSLENICLWETDTDNFSEHFILKEKFDGVFQVELKDSTNANCTLKEEKIQEIQRCLKSFKWRRTTVPPCKGGFPLIEVSALAQAVIVYMKDHYPITPEEMNYHAELKAASHWSWSNDYTQLSMKKVPFDDCRLKIAATEALKTWKKMEVELQFTRGNKIKGKVDKKLSDVRKAIDVLKKFTVQGENPTGGDTEKDMERNSERRTSPPKSRGKNHLAPNGMRFGEFQQLLKVAVRKDAMAPALRANCIEEHPSAAGTKSLQNGSPKKRKHEANSDGTVLAKRIKPAQRRISPRLQPQTIPVNV